MRGADKKPRLAPSGKHDLGKTATSDKRTTEKNHEKGYLQKAKEKQTKEKRVQEWNDKENHPRSSTYTQKTVKTRPLEAARKTKGAKSKEEGERKVQKEKGQTHHQQGMNIEDATAEQDPQCPTKDKETDKEVVRTQVVTPQTVIEEVQKVVQEYKRESKRGDEEEDGVMKRSQDGYITDAEALMQSPPQAPAEDPSINRMEPKPSASRE